MSIAPFTRIVNPCKTLVYSFAGQMDTSPSPVDVFAKIEFAIKDGKGRLSITGSCGQIVIGMKETPDYVASYTKGWTPEMFARFVQVWDTWHLNNMYAGTPAQRRCPDESTMPPACGLATVPA